MSDPKLFTPTSSRLHLTVFTRAANAVNATRSMRSGRLHVCEALLERLPQHFEHVPLELGKLIKQEHTMMGQRHLARHGHLAADQRHVGNGLVGRTIRPRGDKGGTRPGETGDAEIRHALYEGGSIS
jgi:hypothetical protein